MGVDAVVLGLAAVDGLHVEGVAEDEVDALTTAEIGKPVPGEHTFDRDDEIAAVAAGMVGRALRLRSAS